MPKNYGLAWTSASGSRNPADFHHTPFPDAASGLRRLWPGSSGMPNLQPGWRMTEGDKPTPISDTRSDGMVQVLLGVRFPGGDTLKLSPAGKRLRDGFEPQSSTQPHMPVTAISRPGADGVFELAIPVPAESSALRFLTDASIDPTKPESRAAAAAIWSTQSSNTALAHEPSLADWMAMPPPPSAQAGHAAGFLWRASNTGRAHHIHLGDRPSPSGAMASLQDGWLPPGADHPHDAIAHAEADKTVLVYLGCLSPKDNHLLLSPAGERLRCSMPPDGLTHLPVFAIPRPGVEGTFELAVPVGLWELPLLTGPQPDPNDLNARRIMNGVWRDKDESNALQFPSLHEWKRDPHGNSARQDVRYAQTPQAARTLPRDYQHSPEFAAILAREAATNPALNPSPAAASRARSPGP